MLEARREFEASLSNSSGGADFGQMMLIFGAAVLGAILIAMQSPSADRREAGRFCGEPLRTRMRPRRGALRGRGRQFSRAYQTWHFKRA